MYDIIVFYQGNMTFSRCIILLVSTTVTLVHIFYFTLGSGCYDARCALFK